MAQLNDLAGGACVGMDDPDLFFGDRHQQAAVREFYCNTGGPDGNGPCPVRDACLQVAVTFEMQMAEGDELPRRYGSWGGVGPNPRRAYTPANLPTTAAARSQARGAA